MTRSEFAATPFAAALSGRGASMGAAEARPYVFAHQDFVRRATMPFRHRQAFAARALGGGVVLHLMANSLQAYDSPNGFARGRNQLHAAAVLYGTSLTALLSDDAWTELRLADFLQRLGELPSDASPLNPYAAIVDQFSRSNTSFFICNNALHDLAQALARSSTGSNSDSRTYDALLHGVKPRALVVPAGVAAINALQEYRFTLLQATV